MAGGDGDRLADHLRLQAGLGERGIDDEAHDEAGEGQRLDAEVEAEGRGDADDEAEGPGAVAGAMAPQMGPKEAPTRPKTPGRSAATPVPARSSAMVTPTSVESERETPGSMVAKLLPAMKAQKQAGTMEASAKRKNMEVAMVPPIEPMTAS